MFVSQTSSLNSQKDDFEKMWQNLIREKILNELLSYQKISNNRFGLGFSKDKFEKPTHVGLRFSKNNVGKIYTCLS